MVEVEGELEAGFSDGEGFGQLQAGCMWDEGRMLGVGADVCGDGSARKTCKRRLEARSPTVTTLTRRGVR